MIRYTMHVEPVDAAMCPYTLFTGHVGVTKVSYYGAYSGVSLLNCLHGIHQSAVSLSIFLVFHFLEEFVQLQSDQVGERWL